MILRNFFDDPKRVKNIQEPKHVTVLLVVVGGV